MFVFFQMYYVLFWLWKKSTGKLGEEAVLEITFISLIRSAFKTSKSRYIFSKQCLLGVQSGL